MDYKADNIMIRKATPEDIIYMHKVMVKAQHNMTDKSMYVVDTLSHVENCINNNGLGGCCCKRT